MTQHNTTTEERQIVPAWAEKGKPYVIGYMCLTDFQYELGMASGGNAVYAAAEDCRKRRKCTEACGIVEVKVEAVRIVQEPVEQP